MKMANVPNNTRLIEAAALGPDRVTTSTVVGLGRIDDARTKPSASASSRATMGQKIAAVFRFISYLQL